MLYELHVRDMALISEARLEFGEGLHILTGETGAGKSLLLGSVNMALGAKTSPDIIRRGAGSALSELTFAVGGDGRRAMEELGIEADEDGNIILSRIVSEKRGSCRINGDSQPLSKLKEAGGLLIDIHGQHEHQSLLRSANHIRILDGYAAVELGDLTDRLRRAYTEYKNAVRALESQDTDSRQREREISLLEHELSEIKGAALKENEEEELEQRYRLLANGQKIRQALSAAGNLLSSDSPVSEGLSAAIREVTSVAEYEEEIGRILDILLGAEESLTEAGTSLRSFLDRMDFDEEELYNTEKRLDLINTLKQKYGSCLAEIEEYAARSEERLAKLRDFDTYLEELSRKADESRAELDRLCAKVSDIRKKAAKRLEEAVRSELHELNFLEAGFIVDIKKSKDYTPGGLDEVEFLISMNPGEPPRPLAQIASGGELSRIMLALRTVSAVRDGIDTLIFDEIDAGISGVTAGMVAKKLSDLSRGRQVICITHLPQIAAYADRHYLIEKKADGDVTTTSIEMIDEKASQEELVRLLGGTRSAAQTARELRDEALAYKGHTGHDSDGSET